MPPEAPLAGRPRTDGDKLDIACVDDSGQILDAERDARSIASSSPEHAGMSAVRAVRDILREGAGSGTGAVMPKM